MIVLNLLKQLKNAVDFCDNYSTCVHYRKMELLVFQQENHVFYFFIKLYQKTMPSFNRGCCCGLCKDVKCIWG